MDDDRDKVVVTGIGLVSALGDNLEANWQQLLAKKTAIKLHQPFPELPPLPLAFIGKQPEKKKTLTLLISPVYIFFVTQNPADIPDAVLDTMSRYPG